MKCKLYFNKPHEKYNYTECEENDPEMNLVVMQLGGFRINVDKFYFADKEGFKNLVGYIETESIFKEQEAANYVRNGIKELLNISDDSE